MQISIEHKSNKEKFCLFEIKTKTAILILNLQQNMELPFVYLEVKITYNDFLNYFIMSGVR